MTNESISKEQFKNLKILLKDMVDCSNEDDRWISHRRKEEIECFLEDYVK